MLSCDDPRGEALGGVIRKYGHLRLRDQRAGVDARVNEVDGASMLVMARFDGASVGVKPRKVWKKRGVDVYQSSVKSLNELRLYNDHEAREGYEVGFRRFHRRKDRLLERGERGVLPSSYKRRWNVGFPRDGEPSSIRPVRDNVTNSIASLLLNQGLKVGTSSG